LTFWNTLLCRARYFCIIPSCAIALPALLPDPEDGGLYTLKKRMEKFCDAVRNIGVRSVLVAFFVLLLTAGIAVYTGRHVLSNEKEILQQRGELNAKEAAMEYDRCLLTRVNIVTLVGRTVENMLASGSTNEMIKAYLTEETNNILATLDPSTTGLYGWINREYLDGAGWVPDDDFVPTQRPWYTETIDSDQEITFVEPYLDLQTNTIMMTVSDLMSDGESVLAMDVSLEPIQKIVEKVASTTEGSQALVLDDSGIVVAHSDMSQLGRNYLAETDSLGGAVARKILSEGQMQFDLQTAEGNYSVYVDRLEGEWFSISLINADVWYRPLTRAMIIFYAVLALAVLILVYFFLRLYAKNRTLQRLHTRITLEETRGKKWKELSETDRMTGLFDRVSGERMVNELLESGHSGMFIELDIDDFKHINDTYGHQTGDLAIQAVADALRATFRANDVMMRLGGDEFCVYAVGIVDREMGRSIVSRLFDRIRNLQVEGLPNGKISVSTGAVIHSEKDETSFAYLYACADRAMYGSKKRAGNSLTFGNV